MLITTPGRDQPTHAYIHTSMGVHVSPPFNTRVCMSIPQNCNAIPEIWRLFHEGVRRTWHVWHTRTVAHEDRDP